MERAMLVGASACSLRTQLPFHKHTTCSTSGPHTTPAMPGTSAERHLHTTRTHHRAALLRWQSYPAGHSTPHGWSPQGAAIVVLLHRPCSPPHCS